jgi:murein DD-endopeptidase MepM/ murein hydrolase activator NlpD
MTWLHPFPKKTVTSHFGSMANRLTPHRGTDYAPGPSVLIRAVTDGELVEIRWSNILGWVSIQKTHDGQYVGYCHLSCWQHGINCKGPSQHKDGSNCMKSVKVGTKLKAGVSAVGRVGNTGSASRGAHLHITLGKTQTSPFYGTVRDFYKFVEQNQPCKCCGK